MSKTLSKNNEIAVIAQLLLTRQQNTKKKRKTIHNFGEYHGYKITNAGRIKSVLKNKGGILRKKTEFEALLQN